ncbi:MAG: hypothetical protein JHC95_05560 [Solirubrobacteraceae bacterium]|nr:hypothetical protein [Solirubrobacteraceae bacterium]
MRFRLLVPVALALAAAGCGDDAPSRTGTQAATTTATTTAAKPASRPPALCGRLTRKTTGQVQDERLDELSGLVISRTNPELLYTHEDSGAGPELWALRIDGALAGMWTVPGAEAIDWEDIATGPAGDGTAWLYLADIGDNQEARDAIDIYRVPEPAAGAAQTAPAERLRLHYPDGAHNAETLLVDPRRGDLVIVTKGITDGRVYSLPGRAKAAAFAGEATLTKGPSVGLGLVTAGDVSGDGTTIAIRTYASLSVWRRTGSEPIATTMKRTSCSPKIGLIEGQGEALALDRTGTTARTVVEGKRPALRRYRPASAQ